MTESTPRITFACELDSGALQDLFSRKEVISALQKLGAAVSMGILDLTAERARVVQQLNKASIPVIAWQLLPKEQGYWYNLNNAHHALERYRQFCAWAKEHHLQFEAIGVDIEPDINEVARLSKTPLRLLPLILRRLVQGGRVRRAQAAYQALIRRIQADGYQVESYQFPIIYEERQARSTLLQRLAGIVDVHADREVWMLYSSFLRPLGAGVLWSYGAYAHVIGIGSTGGGVDIEGVIDVPPLTWEELRRDLLLAKYWTENIFLFSLEGCVRQGYLEYLLSFDWHAPVPIPHAEVRKVNRLRSLLNGILWLSARPLLALWMAVLALILLRWFHRRAES